MEKEETGLELRVLSTPEEVKLIEDLHGSIWGRDEVVPMHILRAIVHDGGIAIGAFMDDKPVGYVYSFIGLKKMKEDELRVMHCSHEMGILPEYRDKGLGFTLKRAQWQLVRQQGIDLITWTYDPLESRNGYLNIAKLGGICNTYLPEFYGEMVDGLNAGLPSDRFHIELWVNTDRVKTRLSIRPRRRLDLADFIAAEVPVLNTTKLNDAGFAVPHQDEMPLIEDPEKRPSMTLFEIPADYREMVEKDIPLALEWRMYSRTIFQLLFHNGYIVTDFVYLPGNHARAYYVLSHGQSLLGVK